MADNSEYINQMKAEKDNLDPSVFVHASRLLSEEIDRVERGIKYTEVHNDRKTKLVTKVLIPVREYPKVNFVGKLMGPGGTAIKQLQAETGCKMSIMGKGSMKDRKKAEELLKSGDSKYSHLAEDLHVQVEVFAEAADAYSRVSNALGELAKFMVPDFDDQGMQFQNGNGMGEEMGHMTMGRGRGRGRGAPRGHPAGPPAAGGRGGLLGSAPVRGRGAPRGAARGMGAPRGRGAPAQQAYAAPAYEETYQQPYEEQGYGGEYEQTYETAAYAQPEEQYFDYGAEQAAPQARTYETGFGGNGYSAPTRGARGGMTRGRGGDRWGSQEGAAPTRGRGKTDFRAHPYGGRGARGATRGGY